MKCHFVDREGIMHDILIQESFTVNDLKKEIENIMLIEEFHKINKNQEEVSQGNEQESKDSAIKPQVPNHSHINNYKEISLSTFKYRRDLITIQFKMYTFYNGQKLKDFDIKEEDLFIVTPVSTVQIFFSLPVNSTKYFKQIFKPQFLCFSEQKELPTNNEDENKNDENNKETNNNGNSNENNNENSNENNNSNSNENNNADSNENNNENDIENNNANSNENNNINSNENNNSNDIENNNENSNENNNANNNENNNSNSKENNNANNKENNKSNEKSKKKSKGKGSNSDNDDHTIDKNDKLRVNASWSKKKGWVIGPISILFSTDCVITLLNAIEAVFCAKRNNIKVFDGNWSELRTLSSISPITKDNLVFGLYIRNQMEEALIHPNKNITAWTNVFKYKYFNLPVRGKNTQLLRAKSNSKLPAIIAQPIPQEGGPNLPVPAPKIAKKNIDGQSNEAIPLSKSKSGPIRGNSQIKLQKTKSIVLPRNNENLSSLSIAGNSGSMKLYHPVPVFFSYANKKVLACFDSDQNVAAQLIQIKKDLGIPESTKINLEINNKLIDLNHNPEDLKIIEFSTLKIVTSGSCLLI